MTCTSEKLAGSSRALSERVDAHALWPAAVLASDAVDDDLEIGNGIEQQQIADRALDMLVDLLARPAAAVAV